MEVGGEGDYISLANTGACVTTRMIPALRWAAMRAILIFQQEVMDKEHSVHKPQPFGRERRAEVVSNRGPSAYQPNALPLGQTGSLCLSTAPRPLHSSWHQHTRKSNFPKVLAWRLGLTLRHCVCFQCPVKRGGYISGLNTCGLYHYQSVRSTVRTINKLTGNNAKVCTLLELRKKQNKTELIE